MGSRQFDDIQRVSRPVLVVLCFACMGCSIQYREHHQTDYLRLFHNTDHLPHKLDPVWAEMTLDTMAREFGIELEEVTPVEVYIDCDTESSRPSRFNRLTKRIVLRVGQAELPRLYIHELTHLLLDHVDGSPPYWVDQGLAEYMESRCGRVMAGEHRELLPPFVERDVRSLRRIGWADVDEVEDRLSNRAINEGWSWASPFVHYLLGHRWAGRSFSSQIRQLIELSSRDVERLAPSFVAYYENFDPVVDFVGDYRRASSETRLALIGEMLWRFNAEKMQILDRLLAIERNPILRRLIAGELLAGETTEAIGRRFEAVIDSILPEPIPALSEPGAEALARYLLDERKIVPTDEVFASVATFLAREKTTRTPLALDTVLPWLERWPERMKEFASRRDVQDACIEKLDSIGPEVLKSLLSRMPLVVCHAEGFFADDSAESESVGRLWLENRLVAFSEVTAPESFEGLRDSLVHLSRIPARSEDERRVQVRAAVLAAYFGAGLDLRWLHPEDPDSTDAVLFAASFLPRSALREARRRVNELLEEATVAEPFGSHHGDATGWISVFSPVWGLESCRAPYRNWLAWSASRPELPRRLTLYALYRDSTGVASLIDTQLKRGELGPGLLTFLQLVAGIDCGVQVERSESSLHVRVPTAHQDPDAWG